MPGAARYGQGRRDGSMGLYLASDAGRGKPVSSYGSGWSLQRAVNRNDSQTGVKLGKSGTNANNLFLPPPSVLPSCPTPSVRPFWGERRGNQSTEQVQGGTTGKEQVEVSGRTQAGSSWGSITGGGKVRGRRRLHRTASGGVGAHRSRRGAEHFGRYLEVAGLMGAPHRCREVPITSQEHKFFGRTPFTWLPWRRAVLVEEWRYTYRGFMDTKSWSSKDGIWGQRQLGKKVRRKTLGNRRRGEVSVFDDGSEKHRRASERIAEGWVPWRQWAAKPSRAAKNQCENPEGTRALRPARASTCGSLELHLGASKAPGPAPSSVF